mmetsp:Transcript_10494/g.28565  ORF Transcript_10494/g.28565 Transcript_10494/m.28565 type:complete len:284 (+) Transcript_10494:290-1141(+)
MREVRRPLELRRGGTQVRVDLQEVRHQVVEVRRVLRGQRLVLGLAYVVAHHGDVGALEWRLGGCHLVEEHAQSPHVRFERVGLTLHHLRAQVVGSSDARVRHGGRVAEDARDAKVAKLEYIGAGQPVGPVHEDVLGLEVAVQHMAGVHVGQAIHHLHKARHDLLLGDQSHAPGLAGRRVPAHLHPLREGSRVGILHDDVQGHVPRGPIPSAAEWELLQVRAKVVDHVWVVQALEHVHLHAQLVGGGLWGQHHMLDTVVAPRGRGVRERHVPSRPPADDADLLQ